MIESGPHKPFSDLEKIPLQNEQEGKYTDLYELKQNPRWVVKEQKDSVVWPSEYFERELEGTQQTLDLAHEYLGEALPETMLVVGEADPEKNKYKNSKKIYFVQERIDGKSLYESDTAMVNDHSAELDQVLEGVVRVYKDSWSLKEGNKKKTGVMLDVHAKNLLIGKKWSAEEGTKEQLWFVDVFPTMELQYKAFLRALEDRIARLREKGIDTEGSEFTKFHEARKALEVLCESEK